MLKNISNLGSVLSKSEQKSIQGGSDDCMQDAWDYGTLIGELYNSPGNMAGSMSELIYNATNSYYEANCV